MAVDKWPPALCVCVCVGGGAQRAPPSPQLISRWTEQNCNTKKEKNFQLQVFLHNGPGGGGRVPHWHNTGNWNFPGLGISGIFNTTVSPTVFYLPPQNVTPSFSIFYMHGKRGSGHFCTCRFQPWWIGLYLCDCVSVKMLNGSNIRISLTRVYEPRIWLETVGIQPSFQVTLIGLISLSMITV